jgi:PAS domain S-box-containing protein
MAHPLFDSKGTPQSYYLFITPKMESLQRHTDAISCQSICENAPLMIHGFDLHGHCVLWNKECEKMLGWKKNEVTSFNDISAIMHPDPNELERVLNDRKRLNKVFHEYQVHTKDHSKRMQSWASFMVPDRIIISVGYDITEYKRIKEKWYQSTNTIKTINDGMIQFDRALESDLHAQLYAIKNYTTFLQDDLGEGLSDDHKTYINGLIRATQEAKEMVEGLVTWVQVARPGHPVEDICMEKFMQELITLLNSPSDVYINLWKNWPNLHAAPDLLQQVFLNLIDNAITYNRATHKLVEIGWRELDNDQYEFFVRDNGIGINARYMGHIFGVFERLHTSEEFPGTGIGLAIVQKAIHSLNGSIRVESTPGEGTTFLVTLPKVQ